MGKRLLPPVVPVPVCPATARPGAGWPARPNSCC